MLDHPHPEQVSGDDRAGFFRHPEPNDPNRELEAYSWGGLTSRSKFRSLWLLLLPFTLTNMGGWMVETDPDKPASARQWHAEVQERVIRVISILLTVNFVAWIAALAVDLVAYQCGGANECIEDHWWLGPLEGMAPQHRIFVGVGFTLLVYGLVDFLGRRVRSAYDEFKTGTPEAGDSAGLTEESFWFRPSLVRDLARLHRGCVMLSMAATTALTLAYFETSSRRSAFLWTALVLGTAAVFTAFATAILRLRRLSQDAPRRSKAPYALVVIPLAALVVMLGFVWTPDASAENSPALLVHFRRLPILLLVAQLALVVLVVFVQFGWWVKQALTKGGGGDRQTGLANGCAAALFVLGLGFLVTRSYLIPVLALFLAAAVLIAEKRVLLLVITSVAAAALSVIFHFATGDWQGFPIIAFLVAGWWAVAIYVTWRPSVFRWGGMAVLPLLGNFLLGGVMVGAGIRLLDFLDKNDDVKALSDLSVPSTYYWFAMAFAAALFLTAFSGLLINRQAATDDATVPLPRSWPVGTHIPETKVDLEGDQLARAKKAIKGAVTVLRTTRAADILLTWLTGITLIIFVFGMIIAGRSTDRGELEAVVDDRYPFVIDWPWLRAILVSVERLFTESYPFISEWEWLRTSSSWLLALLPLGIVWAMRSGTKDEDIRRKIGVIWDIGTFWPRRFHPLAPPSYPERAVPELQQRLREAIRLDRETKVPRKVVLLGHSQGSVVCLAAAASLTEEELHRVWLVTYGSPLNGIYRRFFPNYFNEKLFKQLANRLNRRPLNYVSPAGTTVSNVGWRNYYRWTDAISAPIQSRFNDPPVPPESFEADPEDLDQPLYDPWWWWLVKGQPGPTPLSHSNYLDDPKFVEWVSGLPVVKPTPPAVATEAPEEETGTSSPPAPSSTPGQS